MPCIQKRIPYLLTAACTLGLGAALVLFAAKGSFLRGTGGDFLVVIFIYAGVKTLFPDLRPAATGAGVFLFSLTVELLQLRAVKRFFDTGNILVQLTLGSTFDPMDIAAYAAGVACVTLVDLVYLRLNIEKKHCA